VQEKLIQLGHVQTPKLALSDGNQAGAGDRIRARLNSEIDAGGQKLSNRDTLKVVSFRGPDIHVRRLRLDGTWTEPFRIPRSYLASDAELDYAGNVHVAQGRTVDTAQLYVSETLSKRGLYVGMTRGRESNTAHVVTGNTAPEGHEPYEQATAESVLKSVMQREDADLSATEQIRMSQEWSGGTGHVLNLWSVTVRQSLYPQIDELIKTRLTEHEARRYEREHSRAVLQNKLREYQLAGHDVKALIEQITEAPMDGARSISSVLHGRLERIELPETSDVTWVQRTPDNALPLARELAVALDDRARELGERLAAKPEPWLAKQLGVLPHDASALLREDYVRRAAIGASYREGAGITDPEQVIGHPHTDNPELEAQRQATIRALEVVDEEAAIRGLSRGELEAMVLEGQRALANAPENVSEQLRLTAQAEADAWQQAANAQVVHDEAGAANAKAAAGLMAAKRAQLEMSNGTYEGWSGDTAVKRENAAKAQAELERRGLAQQPGDERQPEPSEQQTMTEWWRQFEADVAAAERAIEREHQAAVVGNRPWPPEKTAQAEGPRDEAQTLLDELQRDGDLQGAAPDPEASEPEPDEPVTGESGPQPEDGSQAARLDELQARADEAVRQISAQRDELDASSAYQARVEREAQAEPEQQAETPEYDEIEL